jgi:uncharacterized membrane protein YdjX (TVP38/TMEM64 family)
VLQFRSKRALKMRIGEHHCIPYLWKAIFLLALVGVMAGLALAGIKKGWYEPQVIEASLRDMGAFAPLGFMVLMAFAVVTIVLPSIVLDAVAGVVFGPFMGTVYAVLGAEAGALIAFFTARKLGRAAITKVLKKDIAFCDICAKRQLPFIIFVTRLIPFFSFELVSYGAGLTAISSWAYAISTLLGMIPPTFMMVYFGKAVFSGIYYGVSLSLGSLMVLLFFLVPIWIKKKNPWGLYDRIFASKPSQANHGKNV